MKQSINSGLIISEPTGIIFTNQVGGLACYQHEQEGVLIQAHYCTECKHCQEVIDELHELVMCFGDFDMTKMGPDGIKKVEWYLNEWIDGVEVKLDISGKRLGYEAWLPVIISKSYYGNLDKFVGKEGIFTYSNCD